MRLTTYIKRGIRYILYDHRPQVIYVTPAVVDKNEMFKNKIVLVTGGSSGIGLSIAKCFDSQGANVVITGRNEEKLKEAVCKMKNAIYVNNDIRDIDKHNELLNFIFNKFGKLDILVNNAGISNHEKDFLTVTEKDFDDQFNTNLKGAYFLTQNCIKRNLNSLNKSLNVIFISSERGDQCDYLPYGLTKVAMNSLVKGLSYRYVKDGIRVNAVAPGVTVSGFNKLDKHGNLSSDKYISGRFFIPEEISETVLFIASDYSKCISGEIIHCNNGNHLNSYF